MAAFGHRSSEDMRINPVYVFAREWHATFNRNKTR